MNTIKYIFEDVNFSKSKLYPKYKFVDFITKKKKYAHSISFIFCSDNYLKKINSEFLKHEYFTDVITFNYNVKKRISGDIFISADRVKDNANTYNIKFKKELARVMIHGVLHLIGYDDKTEKDKKLMEKNENEFLKFII